ncbi:ATP-binding cassette domain-containing protein [Agromyces soli]|uniref:ATP-binding cassette domain-containing protein n=1 Tax=Agromyces soli TaxID=659012 RepID=A0ABY4B1M5_9MICO|nr:ATP-binding cassette domain-containing protein [Agromyces soli]UOE26925.1 ATP-binding cassette domain-containing protein [Agromyces soli]
MRLTVDAVGHRFASGPWLFRAVSVTLEPGHVYALTGPSGSGKSTLLGILADWIRPTEGAVERDSIDRVTWVFQNPHGVPKRRALDHVALPLLAQGRTPQEADEIARGLLSRFRLEHLADRRFRELSGGEAQRLMLARGVAAKPDLFLIDEPTAQLDRLSGATVNEVLAATAQEHSIVVVATHDAQTREACTDHIDLGHFATETTEASRTATA